MADDPKKAVGANSMTEQSNLPAAYFGETVTRRRLFERAAMAVGGLTGALIGVPVIGFALGPVFKRERMSWQSVGRITDLNTETFVQKTMKIATGVGEAGKTTVYVRKRNDKIDPPNTPEIVAISTRCTHLGCPVSYVSSAERFVCPCHGGVYDFQGERTGGPPVRPLDRFNTRLLDNGEVQVGDRVSFDSKFNRFSPRDPGEHLNGLWKYLYPKRFTTSSIHQRQTFGRR